MENDLKQQVALENRSSPAGAEDRETLIRARGGDAEAAVQLIDRFYPRIYGFLRRLTANDTEAADLTQRTFARLWQALAGFAGRSSVASWIHSIAYHVYVDWRRADHRTEPRSNDWWDSQPAAAMPPDEEVAQTDFARRIYGMVNRLEAELRDTIHLHYYQNLSLQETADAMDVATSTVKYRLRQALTELEGKLGEERTWLGPSSRSRTI